jgi:hypothetical protein
MTRSASATQNALTTATPSEQAPTTRSRGRGRNRVEAPVALGSLTQPGSRSGTVCKVCASPRVTSLTLTLTDGTPVEFTSCHACEARSWLTEDGELDRQTVLERTRKIR